MHHNHIYTNTPTYNVEIPKSVERPVDNLKFVAYKKIAESYEDAVELIKKKKPVLGEPVVVPYYYTHDEIDASTGENIVTVELVLGIGCVDPEHPYITTNGDNIVIDINGEQVSLKEKLESIAEETADSVLATILHDDAYMTHLVDKIMETLNNQNSIQQLIDDKVESMMSWKNLKDMI